MENVVDAFRLLHLPFAVQKRVLLRCSYIEQLAVSRISKYAASIFKSLRISAYAKVSMTNPIRFEIRFGSYSTLHMSLNYGNGQEQSVEKIPNNIKLDFYGDGPYSKPPVWSSNLTFRDWLLHFIDIYHNFSIIDLEFLDQSQAFDIESVKAALRRIETPKLKIRQMTNGELFKKITKLFLPAKRLEVDHDYQPADIDHFRQILLQNFDHFSACVHRSPYYNSLDNLLSINATSIDYLCTTMTDKTINRFLKLWIKGAMPRLKRLFMRFVSHTMVWKKNNIMNGINYTELAEDDERIVEFEFWYGPESETVYGGLSVLRCDGVEANIHLTEHYGTDNLINLCLFV